MKEKEEAAKIGRSRASSSKSQTEGAASVRRGKSRSKKKVLSEKETNRMVQSERDNRRVLLETNSGKWKIGELSKGGAD